MVEKTKADVTKNKKGNNEGLAVTSSILSLKNTPTRAAGIEAKKICGKYEKKNFIFFLKKNKTDKNVAEWKKISKVRDGVKLKSCWTKFKWPLEETGRNSVIPWTKPRNKNCNNCMDSFYMILIVITIILLIVLYYSVIIGHILSTALNWTLKRKKGRVYVSF